MVAKMLKAIHGQRSEKAAREKAETVVEELHSMKLKEAGSQHQIYIRLAIMDELRPLGFHLSTVQGIWLCPWYHGLSRFQWNDTPPRHCARSVAHWQRSPRY